MVTTLNERAQPLAEIAYERLRREILTGKLKPGNIVSVVSLARAMGFSRSPVRDAAGRLESEGLLTVSASGVQISTPNRYDLLDALTVRASLEGLAAKLAAPFIDSEDIEALEAIHGRFSVAIAQGQTQEARTADLEFHQRIQNRCGNNCLVDHLNQVQAKVILAVYSTAWSSNQTQAVLEHKRILEALRNQDSEAAERAAVMHLENLMRRIRQEWKRRDALGQLTG